MTQQNSNPSSPASRRRFLQQAAGAAAAAALPVTTIAQDAAAPAVAPSHPTMKYRTLGRTGLRVSEVGVGGYPVSDGDVIKYALDQGINYVDTSHCYRGGASERAIGEGLAGIRDRIVLATKWCPHHSGLPFAKASFLKQLDESLARLKTDYVDLIFNHEVGRNSDRLGVERLRQDEMFEAFDAAKQAGKARYLGVSGHDADLMEIMHEAVRTGRFDALLCRFSFLDYPEQSKLMEAAREKNVGFIAMKTLAGAKGSDLDKFRDRHTTFKQAALKWVLSHANVSNLVVSISSRRQVDEYAAASGPALTAADDAILREYAAEFSTQVCRFCGACAAACPENVRIADILRFSMYYHEYGQEQRGIESYANLVAGERAAHCTHCAGHCESACGYDLPIRTLLLKAHGSLHQA